MLRTLTRKGWAALLFFPALLLITVGGCPSGQDMPASPPSGWVRLYADEFDTNVPLGAFSGCNNNVDTAAAFCTGLAPYPDVQANLWAYPTGWADTARSGADGNTGSLFGGTYHPEETISIQDGVLRARMFQPTTEPASPTDPDKDRNHVAVVVPRKCMDRTYGRFTERFRVVPGADEGFKAAHLHYAPPYEIDFPESDTFTDGDATLNEPHERPTAFSHYYNAETSADDFNSSVSWFDWHTYTTEILPTGVRYYIDGTLLGESTRDIPAGLPWDWDLQNESLIGRADTPLSAYADPGDDVTLEWDWVTCERPA